ncbi:hypothetical protein DW822_06775 [Bifidobacterium pseudocatenulatum]|nr:hypothetical protein DW822_06775 [Bifidobacterium pseudocatenulatum]
MSIMGNVMMMTVSELAKRCEGVVSAAGIKKALVDGRIRGHQQDGPGTLWLADPTDPKVAAWIEEADRRHAAAPSRPDLERRIANLERELAEEGERNLRLLQRALDAEAHARGMAEEHAREIEQMAWRYERLARRCAASKTSKSTRRSVYGGFRTA